MPDENGGVETGDPNPLIYSLFNISKYGNPPLIPNWRTPRFTTDPETKEKITSAETISLGKLYQTRVKENLRTNWVQLPLYFITFFVGREKIRYTKSCVKHCVITDLKMKMWRIWPKISQKDNATKVARRERLPGARTLKWESRMIDARAAYLIFGLTAL